MHRLPRRVEPEWLDTLPAADPAAIRSRRDLERLNVLMRQTASLIRILRAHGAHGWMRRIVDLGGGDGTLLGRLAGQLATGGRPVSGVLVDRQPLVAAATREKLRSLGWDLEVAAADVFDWLERTPAREDTVVLANLFLHHFADDALGVLLARIAAQTKLFVASDPRRSRFTLTASRLIGFIGGNAVTRHDGVISVRAGFTGRELTALWPASGGWRIEEGSTGPFSHYFVARRQAT
jgi:2-polyprenyl-3-methyl-5-hydroxy-6-metoxy-1,4-benzoquinol methylase